MSRVKTASRVDESEVLAVPEPQWTDTWHPISHGRCITAVEEVLKDQNILTKSREYSLSHDSNEMFASWVLADKGNENLGISVIFRNSIDKLFPFGVAAGTHCYICSNLAFTGEFIDFRRHTKGMNDAELLQVASLGITQALDKVGGYLEWHESLKLVRYTEGKLKALAWDAIQEEVVSPQKIKDFHFMLFGDKEREPVYDSTLYGFHGAVIQLIRDMPMTSSVQKQRALQRFISNRPIY